MSKIIRFPEQRSRKSRKQQEVQEFERQLKAGQRKNLLKFAGFMLLLVVMLGLVLSITALTTPVMKHLLGVP